MPSPNNPVPIYTDAGVPVAYTGAGTVASPYVNALASGTTYYAELGSEAWSTGIVQWVHDSAIILTGITYESSAVPIAQLTTHAAAAGGWKAESSITTVTAAGGTAANAVSKLSGACMPRLRAVIVVAGTGGSCVGFQFWKAS